MKNFRGMYVVRQCAAALHCSILHSLLENIFSESSYSAPQVLKVDFRHTTWHSVSHRVGKVERKICGMGVNGGGYPKEYYPLFSRFVDCFKKVLLSEMWIEVVTRPNLVEGWDRDWKGTVRAGGEFMMGFGIL